MTVASALNRKTFAGDDATTSFATTPIKFFDTSDLLVYVTDDTTGVATRLTEDAGYTVSGGDTSAGAVGTVDTSGGSAPHGAVLSGTTLVVVRDVPILQGVDFVQNDASNAEVAEAALDRLVMNVQRLDDQLGRSLVVSDGDVSGADFTVPTPAASKLLGWASDGLSLVNYELTDLTVSAVPTYALDIITAADDDAFFATMVDGMTAETAPAVGDLIALVDVSLTPDDGRKMTLENALKVVNGLTADATPDRAADYLLTYDADAAAAKKVLLNVAVPFASQSEVNTGTATKALTVDLDRNVLGTLQTATGSETVFDFSIPTWARKIKVMFHGLSLSGTDDYLVQIGTGGAATTSGYVSTGAAVANAGVGVSASTAGFIVRSAVAANILTGHMHIDLAVVASNVWISSHSMKHSTTICGTGGGDVALAGVLNFLRVTRTGTDTFDAGSVNVSYER